MHDGTKNWQFSATITFFTFDINIKNAKPNAMIKIEKTISTFINVCKISKNITT